MPRYTNADGVVVDIPSELAERLDGYTPAEGMGGDPADGPAPDAHPTEDPDPDPDPADDDPDPDEDPEPDVATTANRGRSASRAGRKS